MNVQLPIELLQLVTTFPFNVILVMVLVLIVGIIFTLTRKPAYSSNPSKSVNGQKVSQNIHGSDILDQGPEIEEEIPENFKNYLDGVIELYSWFFRFVQKRFVGIADNMTPREFKDAVLLRSPSTVASALDYLVTVFEIANYSKFKLTKEMLDKSLEAVRLMKEMIEEGSSRLSDHELMHDESSSTLSNYEIHAQGEQGTPNIIE